MDQPRSNTFSSPALAKVASANFAALPPFPPVIVSHAHLGDGGIGRHLQEVMESAAATGRELPLASFVGNRAGSPAWAVRPPTRRLEQTRAGRRLVGFLGRVRRVRPWLQGGDVLAAGVAARLERPVSLLAFQIYGLEAFERNRILGGYNVLIAPTPHAKSVREQHDLAQRVWFTDSDWLSPQVNWRIEQEYGLADEIWVSSAMVANSFVSAGIAPDRVRMFPLSPDPRFSKLVRAPEPGIFRVLYCGAWTIYKGVADLVESFRQWDEPAARLRLVGGTHSRAMKLWLQSRRDERLEICPAGDPAPHLAVSDVYTHLSYQDGFGYAPAEAADAGLCTIVSESTGLASDWRYANRVHVVRLSDRDQLLGLWHELALRKL